MRLNVGCGRHILDTHTNIDVARSPHASRDPDIFANALAIPLADGCASEIMAIHIFEHFYFWEAPKALAEWRRLLKPGGLLILEMPDIVKCAKNMIRLQDTGDLKTYESLTMFGMYGDPRAEDPYMCHRWGWTPKTLKKLLKTSGFTDFKEPETQWHRLGRGVRDFRMESRKA